MSAEQAHLELYRDGLIGTVRDIGQQRALWDRDWASGPMEEVERLASEHLDFTADDVVQAVGAPDSPGNVGGGSEVRRHPPRGFRLAYPCRAAPGDGPGVAELPYLRAIRKP